MSQKEPVGVNVRPDMGATRLFLCTYKAWLWEPRRNPGAGVAGLKAELAILSEEQIWDTIIDVENGGYKQSGVEPAKQSVEFASSLESTEFPGKSSQSATSKATDAPKIMQKKIG